MLISNFSAVVFSNAAMKAGTFERSFSRTVRVALSSGFTFKFCVRRSDNISLQDRHTTATSCQLEGYGTEGGAGCGGTDGGGVVETASAGRSLSTAFGAAVRVFVDGWFEALA